MKRDFETYCSNIPVFGLNSSRYDLNLLKECLLHHLLTEKRRCSQCNWNGEHVYWNECSWHAISGHSEVPGRSFNSGYIPHSLWSERRKRILPLWFFPEWFESIEKLNVPQLPAIDRFWSKLKNQNVLAIEFDKFLQMKDSGMEEAILKKIRLNKVPQNTREITGNCRTFVNEMACRRFATSSGGITTKMSGVIRGTLNHFYRLCKSRGDYDPRVRNCMEIYRRHRFKSIFPFFYN